MNWILSDVFQWGYVWINPETLERLEFHKTGSYFVLDDYYYIHSNTVNYTRYYVLVEDIDGS